MNAVSNDPYKRFFELHEECVNTIKRFSGIDNLNNSNLIANRTWARGGRVLHRGFYCPSLIVDITTGNCDRGKLLKNKTKVHPDYIYGFDSSEKLVTVEKYEESRLISMERIFYEGNNEYGLTYYSNLDYVSFFSKCEYMEGLRKSYITCQVHPSNNLKDMIWLEEYNYENSILVSADSYFFVPSCENQPVLKDGKITFLRESHPVLRYDKISFSRDDSGNIEFYTVQGINPCSNEIYSSHNFYCKKKTQKNNF